MNNTTDPDEKVYDSSANSDEIMLMHVSMVITGVFSVLGTTGNALVLYVFYHQKQTTKTFFILTLACTDFTTAIVTMPFTIVVELMEFKIEYDIICKIYQFFITSTIPFSAFMMTVIAVDRYICILHPFKYMKTMTVQRAKIVVLFVFLFAFTLGLLCCLMFGTNSTEVKCVMKNSTLGTSSLYNTSQFRIVENPKMCDENREDEIIQSVLEGYCVRNTNTYSITFMNIYHKVYSSFFGISAVIVIILYCIIYCSVLAGRKNHIKGAVMLSIVALVYIVAFLPAFLMALRVIEFNCVIFYLYFIYNVANPVIYAFLNASFRKDLKILLHKFKCLNKH